MQQTPPYDEHELLQRIAQGSEDAFRILFENYRGKLYHYILTIANSSEMAEDTVHDVFLKLWTGREKLPAISNINAYLYTMCRNHAISGLRRMAKETLILTELRHGHIPQYTDADPLSQKEVQAFIQKAIDKLSPQQRKVFLMNRNQGLKHEQIAQELGISINTVRTHLSKALEFLREEIGQTYGSLAVAIWVIYKLS